MVTDSDFDLTDLTRLVMVSSLILSSLIKLKPHHIKLNRAQASDTKFQTNSSFVVNFKLLSSFSLLKVASEIKLFQAEQAWKSSHNPLAIWLGFGARYVTSAI